MTDKQTAPDWVLLEAAKRSGWGGQSVDLLRRAYRATGVFSALCDMLLKHEQEPVDRKVLCAREAAKEAACGREGPTDEQLCLRAIELWEEGFGK